MDMSDITQIAQDRFDLSTHAAAQAVQTFLDQMGIDLYEDISDEDAAAVLDAIAASLPEISATPLDRVAEAAEEHRRAEAAADFTREARDTAIRAAASAGVPKTQIAEASGLTRQAIYDILD